MRDTRGHEEVLERARVVHRDEPCDADVEVAVREGGADMTACSEQ